MFLDRSVCIIYGMYKTTVSCFRIHNVWHAMYVICLVFCELTYLCYSNQMKNQHCHYYCSIARGVLDVMGGNNGIMWRPWLLHCSTIQPARKWDCILTWSLIEICDVGRENTLLVEAPSWRPWQYSGGAPANSLHGRRWMLNTHIHATSASRGL